MEITQISHAYIKGDAVSNLMTHNDGVHRQHGHKSNIVLSYFSDFDGADIYRLAVRDYEWNFLWSFLKFLTLEDKIGYLKHYVHDFFRYKKGAAAKAIERSDVRIWHFGAFYQLFKQFRVNDIIYYHNITYPYLSKYGAAGIDSKNKLYATSDMEPVFITHSKFNKGNLEALGFIRNDIFLLPPPQKYDMPFQSRSTEGKSIGLLAYGRYAKNKAIPELAEFAWNKRIPLTAFGDNSMTSEFREEYGKAKKFEKPGREMSISGKVDDLDGFYQMHSKQPLVYICNSYHEGWNVPTTEAMAHSIPVLCRRGTAMDEIVVNGRNGYLYDDLSEVPELIDKIAESYDRFAMAAWKSSKRYGMQQYGNNYSRILEEYEKKYK